MKLSLKRLFARSMTGGVDLVGPPAPSSRSAVRKATFITIAGILAVVGAVAGGYYFAMRPVPLKIAVGPPNSDDVRVVQALTQAFNQNHSYVRLRPVQTECATESATALAQGVVGRTPANISLLKVVLQQYGVDPNKVEIVQFPVSEVAEAIRNQKADVYL